jgi:transposase
MKAINRLRKSLPHPPLRPGRRGGGPLRDWPPNEDPSDPAVQHWYWRKLQQRARIARVHELAEQGLSQRAIARQTGHHRGTIRQWLAHPVPPIPEDMPEGIADSASLPAPDQRREKKQRLMRQVHTLRQRQLSYSAISRQVGLHRVTVKKWLQQNSPPGSEEESIDHEAADVEWVPPPNPWSSWEEIRQTREALNKHRFLFMRRPENLDEDDEQQIRLLLSSPIGKELAVVRSFLVDWYGLWTRADGQPHTLDEARTRYQDWRTQTDYRTVPPLRRVQEQMTESKFERMSQFLRHPDWEATNNGAERMGRAFRHRQGPHFNLRSEAAIEGGLVVAAFQKKETVTQRSLRSVNRCRRGRKSCKPAVANIA